MASRDLMSPVLIPPNLCDLAAPLLFEAKSFERPLLQEKPDACLLYPIFVEMAMDHGSKGSQGLRHPL